MLRLQKVWQSIVQLRIETKETLSFWETLKYRYFHVIIQFCKSWWSKFSLDQNTRSKSRNRRTHISFEAFKVLVNSGFSEMAKNKELAEAIEQIEYVITVILDSTSFIQIPD